QDHADREGRTAPRVGRSPASIPRPISRRSGLGGGSYARQRNPCIRRGLCSSSRSIRAERSRGPDDRDCGDERLQQAWRTIPSSGCGEVLRRERRSFWRRGTISSLAARLTAQCDPGGLFLLGNSALHLTPVRFRSGGRSFSANRLLAGSGLAAREGFALLL